jgi:hypothetical protein
MAASWSYEPPYDIDRAQFLRDGFVILRQAVSPEELPMLREQYERLFEIFKANSDAAGSKWAEQPQPRMVLSDSPLADQIDHSTAGAIEVWLGERTHGVSSRLLDCADATVTSMLCMCSPATDHDAKRDWRGWHRDFYPANCSSLDGYAADCQEGGPRYVQWNLPLYDDDVLHVVPGSHARRLTATERASIVADDHHDLATAVPVKLRAGDGVAYILPILHWGSSYSTKTRRTLHGGYSLYSHLPGMHAEGGCRGHLFARAAGGGYCAALAPPDRRRFEAWGARSDESCAIAERMLRAAGRRNPAALAAALREWHTLGGHADRGIKGAVQTLVMLSKAAKRVYIARALGEADDARIAALGVDDVAREKAWATTMHPMTLAWGDELLRRFSAAEAAAAWGALSAIDGAMRAAGEQFEPGFQGGPTRYLFEEVPPAVEALVLAMLPPVPRVARL